MTSVEYYIQLRIFFEDIQDNVELQVTVNQLGEIFHCSTRNVKIILKKLIDKDWITWKAGRGRGNHSKLTFYQPLEAVLIEYVSELIKKEKMNEAIQLLNQKQLPIPLKKRMQDFLQRQFGFQVEKKQDRQLDILKIPFRRKLSSLDPTYVSSASEIHFVNQIFDTLVNYHPLEDRFKPNLAHNWEHNSERTVWSFYIRKEVYFHDGRILTAKDVKYTFERIMDALDAPSRWQIEDILDMKVIDERTISFFLKEPSNFFLHFISAINFSIVPYGWTYEATPFIGTGPFKVKEYSEEKLIFERFPQYFKETALLDRIELWFIPSETDIERSFELPMLDDKEKAKESYTFNEEGCHYLSFNFTKTGIHHHIYFRQAMRVLFDRMSIIEELKGNRIAPANSFLPSISGSQNYPINDILEAKSLLDKSGYQGEEVKLYFFDMERSTEDAIWLQQRAMQIGLHLSLHPFPVSDFYLDKIEKEADLLLMGEILEVNIELSLLNLYKHESSFLRRMLHDTHRIVIDSYIAQFMKEVDKEKRLEIILKIEAYLKESTLILFNYHVKKKINYNPVLKGISWNSFGWADFRRLWIKPLIKY